MISNSAAALQGPSKYKTRQPAAAPPEGHAMEGRRTHQCATEGARNGMDTLVMTFMLTQTLDEALGRI